MTTSVYAPHMILEYVLSSSKVGVVQLRILTKRPHITHPISDARAIGVLDKRSDLVLGLSNASGLNIHRLADGHFEGREDITWMHFTISHCATGTTINTDIPIISHAVQEHALWLKDPTKRKAEISGWLENLVGDM